MHAGAREDEPFTAEEDEAIGTHATTQKATGAKPRVVERRAGDTRSALTLSQTCPSARSDQTPMLIAITSFLRRPQTRPARFSSKTHSRTPKISSSFSPVTPRPSGLVCVFGAGGGAGGPHTHRPPAAYVFF